MAEPRLLETPREDLPVCDLHEVLDLALARGADLLTAGELRIARRMRALQGPPARLYARLTGRKPDVFWEHTLQVRGVEDVGAAVDALAALDLVDHLVPLEGCLPLRRRPGASVRRQVRVRHRGLLRRLEQWAFLRRRPERSRFVVERLGLARWPAYERTSGGLFHDRRALLAWEALYATRDALEPEALLAHLEGETPWPPGNLDLRPNLVGRVRAAARELERQEEPVRARALYARLAATAHVGRDEVAVRVARCLEAEGEPGAALDHLEAVQAEATGASRVAIARTGRRLAASLRRGWRADPALRAPSERLVRIERAETVEAATTHVVTLAGRVVVRGEGPLWTTLFALLFAETYFLPVPGMLPVRFLDGPLDVGTPAFARRRPEAVAEVLETIRSGTAPALVAARDAHLRGSSLAGAVWNRATSEQLVTIAEALGPAGLESLVRVFLEHGWAAAAGLPDLVILPGPEVRLERAHPALLTAGLILVEVKSPTDSVRDGQAVWFDRLLEAGVPVELWQVSEGA